MNNNSTIGSSNSNFFFKYGIKKKKQWVQKTASKELGYTTYPLSSETFCGLE